MIDECLGVKFNKTMSWSSHVDYLANNVSKRFGIIKFVKHFLPHSTLIMLSNVLVIPQFDYASTVWSNFSQAHHTRLQVIHNCLARIILSADIRTPIKHIMSLLQWKKLNERWNNQMLIIVFKGIRRDVVGKKQPLFMIGINRDK